VDDGAVERIPTVGERLTRHHPLLSFRPRTEKRDPGLIPSLRFTTRPIQHFPNLIH
jgi:hypothetical protein